jgi:hypothetical protein
LSIIAGSATPREPATFAPHRFIVHSNSDINMESPRSLRKPSVSNRETVALQNRGDASFVLGCITLWRDRLGHYIEGGHHRGNANRLIQAGLKISRATEGSRLDEFGGD